MSFVLMLYVRNLRKMFTELYSTGEGKKRIHMRGREGGIVKGGGREEAARGVAVWCRRSANRFTLRYATRVVCVKHRRAAFVARRRARALRRARARRPRAKQKAAAGGENAMPSQQVRRRCRRR